MSPDTAATVQIVAVVWVTSAAAFVTGRSLLRLSPRAVRPAVARTLECVGLAVLFYAANVGCELMAAFISRAAGRFASLYIGSDTSLPFLSLLQAMVFQWWRTAGR